MTVGTRHLDWFVSTSNPLQVLDYNGGRGPYRLIGTASDAPQVDGTGVHTIAREDAERNARMFAAAPQLLDELRKAHLIIQHALRLMTDEQKAQWSRINDQGGLVESGITRFHERAAAIAKATGSCRS